MNTEPYRPERDREGILAMLAEAPFFRAQFLAREAQGLDEVWVARRNGEIAGFISFAGRFRKARFTGYVAPAARGRGLGALLMDVADDYYAGNGWTERVNAIIPDAEESGARLLVRFGFKLYDSQHVMERRGGPLPEGPYEARPCGDADYPAYAEINSDAFWQLRELLGIRPNFRTPPGAEDRSAFANRVGEPFVLTDGSAVVGAASVRGSEIATLAVRPGVQGRGYGTAFASFLVNLLLARGFDCVRLHCVDGNPARRLYERLGFEAVGLEREYAKFYRQKAD